MEKQNIINYSRFQLYIIDKIGKYNINHSTYFQKNITKIERVKFGGIETFKIIQCLACGYFFNLLDEYNLVLLIQDFKKEQLKLERIDQILIWIDVQLIFYQFCQIIFKSCKLTVCNVFTKS
eukprot:TRINITY_DN5259_c4_g1_i1.p6 TRINITY_DN5259_c4_g1~~TRINITY_DN5259_c4_g1_i1.p6  ORF type:complete len:122 (-),score=0.09 TRINITY_DN5259_c4_g1_i1:201-566(-)